MQIIIHQWAFPSDFNQLEALPRQEIVNDWYGYDVDPPARFSFGTDGEYLWYLAEREAAYTEHPDAVPGGFQPELWRYDAAEWFLATDSSDDYWEFNLAPGGAWWACAFSGVRTPLANQEPLPQVETKSIKTPQGWIAMARIPLASLKGIDIRHCRLAASFILNSPDQIFLTTALDLSGEPDFHRPSDFPPPILK